MPQQQDYFCRRPGHPLS